MTAKLLFLDIETTPLIAYTWGPKWKTNLIQMKQDSYLLCVGYRWGIDGETKVIGQPDFKAFNRGNYLDDRQLCKATHKLLNEADIVVAHNGDRFDLTKLNSRFLRHGLGRPRPVHTVDTKKVSQHMFNEPSNSLADLGQALGLGVKMPHAGFDMWLGCMAGDMDSWKMMMEYNARDIDLLVDVYTTFRDGGWIKNHPNVSVFENHDGCPTCGADADKLQRRGFRGTDVNRYVQLRCKVCGSYCRSRYVEEKAPLTRRRTI